MLTKLVMNFVLIGAEWVLWLLFILSFLSIAIVIERAIFFVQRTLGVKTIRDKIVPLLKEHKFDQVLVI